MTRAPVRFDGAGARIAGFCPQLSDVRDVRFGPFNLDARWKLRSRASLVAATVVVQAAVMAVVWTLTFNIASTTISTQVRESVLENSRRATQRICEAMNEAMGGPVHAGAESRYRAQEILEANRPGHGAWAVLLDNENQVICLPGTRFEADLRRMDFSDTPIQILPSGEPVTLGQLFPRTPVLARTELSVGPGYALLVYSPELHAKIVVFQPQAGIEAAVRATTHSVVVLGVLSVIAVVTLTGLGSAALIRRYESMLEGINRDLAAEVQRKVEAGLNSRNALIFGLAKLADYRDTDTGRHLERICRYSELLANRLRAQFPEIDDAWIERLRLASSMHDIGKVGIPDSILLKPGQLTLAERRLMEQHPLIGADTLVAIRRRLGDDELLGMGIQVALYHHEHFNGDGYPFGLRGDDIPLCARVVALADVYDALTSPRVYKSAMSHEVARDIITQSRGTQFDPRIVDTFESIHEVFDRVRRELQPDGCEPEKPVLATAVERAIAARLDDATVPPRLAA